MQQSEECREHHKQLGNRIDDLKESINEKFKKLEECFEKFCSDCAETRHFFFGGPKESSKDISLVDKVNIMYENQRKNRTTYITFICTFGVLFITALIGVGEQLKTVSKISEDMLIVLKKQEEIQEKQTNLQVEVAKLKVRVDSEHK